MTDSSSPFPNFVIIEGNRHQVAAGNFALNTLMPIREFREMVNVATREKDLTINFNSFRRSWYDKDTNTLEINEGDIHRVTFQNKSNSEQRITLQDIIIHELQHAVQEFDNKITFRIEGDAVDVTNFFRREYFKVGERDGYNAKLSDFAPGMLYNFVGSKQKFVDFYDVPPDYLNGNLRGVKLLITSKFGGVTVSFGEVFEKCFLAGTPISMWGGTQKPIEHIRVGDVVTSYDPQGNLVPGKVTRTKENRVRHILDVFGLMVTPGHVTFCGDGKFEGRHVPMIDILRSDGALVLEDGSLKRAATNFPVGSLEDRFVDALVTEEIADSDQVRIVESGRIRLGTRFMHPTGADITVLDIIHRSGSRLTEDGQLLLADGVTRTPFIWTLTPRLPKPEDFVLQRSQLTLTDIYEAEEWEAIGPQVPPPYLGEAGAAYARKTDGPVAPGQDDCRPPNIPISMQGAADQPTMSRKQRRAFEARQRKLLKRSDKATH